MNIQYLIVTVILAIAVGYAAWRIYRALRMANDPCYGCEGCELPLHSLSSIMVR